MSPFVSPAEATVLDREAVDAALTGGSPSTSVHPEQLSVSPPFRETQDQLIRFRPWRETRDWLLEHLWHMVPSAKVRERIRHCGQNAWVEYSPSRHRVRIASSACGHRLCPACRAFKASLLAKRIVKLGATASGYQLKLVTLTLRHSKRPLVDQVKALKLAFRKLRGMKVWQRSKAAGVAIVEVERNETTGDWHPHLHVICRAAYMPHGQLKDAWAEATHGSNIVDIRCVHGQSVIARYVSTYLTKPPSPKVMASPELSEQWSAALQNTHWVVPFGKRGSLPKLEQDEGPRDWRRIGPLYKLAQRGYPFRDPDWALEVIVESLNSQVVALCDPESPPGFELDL